MKPHAPAPEIRQRLDMLSLEEKIGQLLLVAFFDLSPARHRSVVKAVEADHLGGLFHIGVTPGDLATVVEQVQAAARIPVLVAADYEIGPGWSMPGGLITPRPMNRAAGGCAESEYELGRAIARQGAAAGAVMTFSPVIDLNTHPQNPDVNIRAYGEEAAQVARFAVPLVRGLEENGLLACAKHFPGNGATDQDQHINAAIIPLSAKKLRQTCLEAYRRVFAETQLAAVMVAHLEVPALTKEINPANGRPVPSSASREIVTGVLRKELGFQGLAISDAMNMGGITTHYSRAEAAVRCIAAGIDMLLIFHPDSYHIERDALLEAVLTGVLPRERVDEAVLRVLQAKHRAGLFKGRGFKASQARLEREFAPGRHEALMRRVTERGLTLLRNRDGLLPVRDLRGRRVAVASTFNPDAETLRVQGQESQLMRDRTAELLRARGAMVEEFELSLHAGGGLIHRLATNADGYELLFLNFHLIPTWAIGSLIPNKSALRLFMNGLLTNGCPVIITLFGDPYAMHHFPAAPVVLCTYDESARAQEAAVRAWCGELAVSGRSPVSLERVYRQGDGLELPGRGRPRSA